MAVRPNSPATKDIAYVMHPYTDPSAHEDSGPQIIQRGDGIYVYDDEGKKFIEGLAGLWYASLGFSEERLVKAATAQMTELPVYHTFSHRSTGPAIELAERIIGNAPAPMSKIFFTCSGSEAVDTAIKIVWYYHNAIGKPEKKKIISRRNGYHGVTVASSSLTGLKAVQAGFDVPIPNLMQTDCPPHYYRFGEDGESEEEFSTRMVDNLEKQILEEGPETVAGVHSRTRDGRWRRRSAARDLLRQGAAAPEEVRRPLHRGRSDLRLRPHRQHVGIADLRSEPRHGHHGQGDLGGIPAHRRGDVQREDLSGPAPTELPRSDCSDTASPTRDIPPARPSPWRHRRSMRSVIPSPMRQASRLIFRRS